MSIFKNDKPTESLVIPIGLSLKDEVQAVEFRWTREALKRDNYKRLLELLAEEDERADRKQNEASAKHAANLAAAFTPTEDGAPVEADPVEVERLRDLKAKLDGLAEHFASAAEATDDLEEAEPLMETYTQARLVRELLEQLERPQVQTEEELRAEVQRRQMALMEAYDIELQANAEIVAHLCPTFRYIDGDDKKPFVEATTDTLKGEFDKDFLKQVTSLIFQAARRPLAISGVIAA